MCLNQLSASPNDCADPAQIEEAQERGLFLDGAEARLQEEPSQQPLAPELMVTFAAPPAERDGALLQKASETETAPTGTHGLSAHTDGSLALC